MLPPPLCKCGICAILRCGGFIHSFLRSWHNISIAPFYLLFTSLFLIADVYLFYFITTPQPPYPPFMEKTTLLCLMCMFCVCVLTRFPVAFFACIFNLSKSFHLMWLFLLFSNHSLFFKIYVAGSLSCLTHQCVSMTFSLLSFWETQRFFLISATTDDIFMNILHMIWVCITFLWNINILGRAALLSLGMVMINPMCSPG